MGLLSNRRRLTVLHERLLLEALINWNAAIERNDETAIEEAYEFCEEQGLPTDDRLETLDRLYHEILASDLRIRGKVGEFDMSQRIPDDTDLVA